MLAFGIQAEAQQDFEKRSRREHKIRLKELSVYDAQDLMSGTTAEVAMVKQELEFYSDRAAKQGSRLLWIGGGMMVVVPIAAVAVGVAADDLSFLWAGLGLGIAGGTVLMVRGGSKMFLAGELRKKRHMLEADVPMLQYDNMALGFSVFHNQLDQQYALGPCLSIRF